MNAASQRENSGNLSTVGVGKSKQIFLQTGLCNRKKKQYIRCLETILLILSTTRLQRKDNNTAIKKCDETVTTQYPTLSIFFFLTGGRFCFIQPIRIVLFLRRKH